MGCGFRRLPLRLVFLFSSVGLLVWPLTALGQFPGQTLGGASGQIVVRVHEADGSPIGRSAMVTVRSPSQLTNVTVPTTEAGQALFTGLHAGDYLVEVSAPGYRNAQAQAIIAADKETENIDVLMVPDSGPIGTQHAPGAPILAPKALKETERGLEALQSDKLDEAEAHLKRALQLAPGFPDVNYLMGLLWLRRHDNAQARGFLEKAVALAPKHAPALQALGEVQFLQHDYPHALAALEQSVSLRPNSWRAHWLAGAAHFQQGEYRKSREECEEALRVGQDKAGSVRFLLGEAHAALGEREAALAALEQFVREQPNVSQAVTAKKLMERLRTVESPKTEAVAANTGATMGAPAKIETTSMNDVIMPPIAPVIETNWAPPDVDEEKLSTDSGASCALKEVTEAAGARVEELVKNVDQFTATEEMEHESLSPLGIRLSKEVRSFNYLVAIRKIGTRGLDVQEYRDGSVSTQPFPAHVATLGLPMLALVFHSYFRDEYEFKCEGRGEWRGRPAWVVHYRQKDNEMSEMRVYRVKGMSYPVRLKGRAWIDAENSQILAMEADMVRTVPEIRLLRDHQMIEYGPVEFRKAKTPMWLPKSADWYCNLAGQRYHRRHSFSHFLLFSVEDTQKIGAPKETQQQ
jgi:tetratricopeptide (TPR) repeat protein